MLGTSQQTGLFSFVLICQKAFPFSPQAFQQMLKAWCPNGVDRNYSKRGSKHISEFLPICVT